MSILAPVYPTAGKMTRPGLICLLTTILVLTGCRGDKTPPGVLDQKQYADYLVNIYIAEAKLNTLAITPDSAMKLFQPFEASLLAKYGVSDSVIQNTYQYYLAHPAQLEQVYTTVIDSLNLMEQKGNTRRP